MRITLDVSKSLEKNAERYFEKSKKSKGKIDGAKEAVERAKKKLIQLLTWLFLLIRIELILNPIHLLM